MLTIGFIGLAGAGKDTACNYMVDVFSGFGLPTNRTSFALPLKTIAKRCFGEGYDDRDNKEVLVPFGVEKVHEAVDMCVVYYKEWLIANEISVCDTLVILNRDGIEPVAHHVSERLASDLICSKAPVQALRKQYGYQGSIHVVSNNGQLWQLRDKIAKLSILIKDEATVAKKLPLDLPFTLES